MSMINQGTFAVEKKNKQQLKKFVSIINDYQQSLNKKVDDLVSHMINYSKKVQESVVKLPQIRQPRSATQRPKSLSKTILHKKENSKIYNRQKSISSGFSFVSELSENMEEKINILKKSAAQSLTQQNNSILPEGRAIGSKRFVKPKFMKKQPDILPREIRLDPFADKNVIKAQDLDKGIMALIERGKIGKDVDIITAFEKGGQVLNAKKAIFHHGQERVARMQPIRPPQRQQVQDLNYSNIITKKTHINYQSNSWAITMPQNEYTMRDNIKKSIQLQQKTKRFELNLQQTYHLKFLHYQPVKCPDLNRFLITNSSLEGQLTSIIHLIGKLLQKYCIEVAYADSAHIIQLSTVPRKITESQLIRCILSFKDQSKIKINQIISISERKNATASRIQALCRMWKQRSIFKRFLDKKKVQKRISNWLYNVHVVRGFRQRIQDYRKKVVQKFQKLQNQFRESYCEIQGQKHYQIHISNKSFEGKTMYRQFMNTEITRIFNFQNPNTHIIIILSEALSQETKNYYYKIMQLQEIANFREKVTFLHLKNYSVFGGNRFTTSQKLYYDSKLMREVKRKIGGCPAYFRISYPSATDVNMAAYTGIPILSGDLTQLTKIQQRSQSIQHFGLPQIPAFRMKPSQYTPLTFSSALVSFCQNHKRYKNYVVKVNGYYQSRGIGLLTYPFSSLPEIYSNTAFIINSQNSAPSQFYRKLCKLGGIIQAFQQSLTSVVVMGKINEQGQPQLTATYDKISYGFVNVGYFFPQVTIPHNQILPIFNSVSTKLAKMGHFGDFQICLFVDENYTVYLDKVQCYQTEIGSSLFYFKFLCQGNLNNKGQYITKITQTFETDENKEEQLISLEPRSYCYLPYILHFGLSEKQVGSFFQLCRMGGISFDLENKYGSTFILLGSLKNSMGMITTAKDRQTCKKLMIKSLDFIIKQNAHNNSKTFSEEKEIKMRERQNILALKERLEDL